MSFSSPLLDGRSICQRPPLPLVEPGIGPALVIGMSGTIVEALNYILDCKIWWEPVWFEGKSTRKTAFRTRSPSPVYSGRSWTVPEETLCPEHEGESTRGLFGPTNERLATTCLLGYDLTASWHARDFLETWKDLSRMKIKAMKKARRDKNCWVGLEDNGPEWTCALNLLSCLDPSAAHPESSESRVWSLYIVTKD